MCNKWFPYCNIICDNFFQKILYGFKGSELIFDMIV
jgi:hypothetical protein